jgi:hypothetical protein
MGNPFTMRDRVRNLLRLMRLQAPGKINNFHPGFQVRTRCAVLFNYTQKSVH